MDYRFEDFTETHYRQLLRLAKKNYEFVFYDRYRESGRKILWRHDVDASMQRAVVLARIEAEEGIRSSFFVHFHNIFYNLLEAESRDCLNEIMSLGHELGLHFDPGYYAGKLNASNHRLDELLVWEREWLEKLIGREVSAFSLHNPDIGPWQDMLSQEEIAGMINVYSEYFKQHYTYCSDSNGYWRYQRLWDVLHGAEHHNVQVLTHPEWWTPEPMTPRDRISRCIDGRAQKIHRLYDELIKAAGRANIGEEDKAAEADEP